MKIVRSRLQIPIAVFTLSVVIGYCPKYLLGQIPADSLRQAAQSDQDASSPEPIDQLILQLGDDSYHVREAAQEQLSQIGYEAYEHLNQVTGHKDLEIAARARYLVRLMKVTWTTDDDPPEVRAIMSDYASKSPIQRLMAVEQLRQLPDGAGLPVLCRQVRCEDTEQIANAAAVALLWLRPVHVNPRANPKWYRATWIRNLQQNLPESKKRTVRVVRTYALLSDTKTDRPQPYQEFKQLVEEVVVEHEKNPAKVQGMITAMDPKHAMNSMNPMGMIGMMGLATTTGNATLPSAHLFHDHIQMARPLLYLLADAQKMQGDDEDASATVERAVKLLRDGLPNSEGRIATAYALRSWGHTDWSINELELAYDVLPISRKLSLGSVIAETLHEQCRDREAAKTLFKLWLDIEREAKKLPDELAETLRNTEMARINGRVRYYRACDAKQKDENDLEGYQKQIDAALEADPNEMDALIARHRILDLIPDLTDEYRKETEKMVEAATEKLRQRAKAEPRSALAHNQLAWLLGNTGGSFTEAILAIQRADGLSPNNASYLDTMAHVYASAKQFRQAIAIQTRATQLEPSSKLLANTLERFKLQLKQQTESTQKTPVDSKPQQNDQ